MPRGWEVNQIQFVRGLDKQPECWSPIYTVVQTLNMHVLCQFVRAFASSSTLCGIKWSVLWVLDLRRVCRSQAHRTSYRTAKRSALQSHVRHYESMLARPSSSTVVFVLRRVWLCVCQVMIDLLKNASAQVTTCFWIVMPTPETHWLLALSAFRSMST